jgi:hypothetical protein
MEVKLQTVGESYCLQPPCSSNSYSDVKVDGLCRKDGSARINRYRIRDFCV